jgi:putative transposase
MDELESLNHSKWECKYHIVFIPKYRRKTLYMQLRQYLGEVFRKLTEQKESRIGEGHLMSDHVHMMISIPPKYAVSQVVGFIKGKSAIHLARVWLTPARVRRAANSVCRSVRIALPVYALSSAGFAGATRT